jgi:hypothetical protein
MPTTEWWQGMRIPGAHRGIRVSIRGHGGYCNTESREGYTMHARGIVGIPLTVQEETSREVVISLAFDQRGVLDVPLVHGPDPVWSALQSQGHPVW